jgi:hypothetical protein
MSDQRDADRKAQAERYERLKSAAWHAREAALSAYSEPERRRLMARADELNARAYHEIA